MDREEVEINKKEKKDLALRILMQEEDEDLDEEMILLTKNFKKFFKKKIGANTSRRQEEEGKEMKKSKENKKYPKDKIQCYKCKGFGHVMHECPIKDKDQDLKGEKVLQATMESDDDDSEDYLSEFCFMTIEEVKEEDFERAFQELYLETIHVAKKNKDSRNNMRQSPRRRMPLKSSSNARRWSSNIPTQERKNFNNN